MQRRSLMPDKTRDRSSPRKDDSEKPRAGGKHADDSDTQGRKDKALNDKGPKDAPKKPAYKAPPGRN